MSFYESLKSFTVYEYIPISPKKYIWFFFFINIVFGKIKYTMYFSKSTSSLSQKQRRKKSKMKFLKCVSKYDISL